MARKMHRTTRLKITELNPHLMCALCGGYLVNASTIVECLHSFCKTCIVKFLQTSKFCPLCDAMIHKTKPLSNVRPDKTLQNLVYKLVPNLFKNEMQKRRCFFAQNPTSDTSWNSNEDRGEVDEDKMMIYTEDDQISLSLEYSDIGKPEPEVPPPPPVSEAPSSPNLSDDLNTNHKRYLLCPAGVTVSHLKKFIRMKFDLPLKLKITIFHTEEPLNEEFTLMDVAYIYAWRRRGPLRLFYNVCENKQKKRTICAESVDSLVTKKATAIGSTNGEISSDLSSKGKHGKSTIDESLNSSMRSTPDSHASVVTSVRDS